MNMKSDPSTKDDSLDRAVEPWEWEGGANFAPDKKEHVLL